MATPQLSPGVIVREVDLTVGRADNVLDNVGAIAGPFSIGPVDEVIEVSTESELLSYFGKPISTDGQQGYWLSASTFLSYGGILKVVRVDDDQLNNANATVGGGSTTDIKIKNYDHYEQSTDTPSYAFAAQTPGSWGNTLKVAVIDDKADQTIGIAATNLGAIGVELGNSILVTETGLSIPNTTGGTDVFSGQIKGVITGVHTAATGTASFIDVKVVSRVTGAGTSFSTTGAGTGSAGIAGTVSLPVGTTVLPLDTTPPTDLTLSLNRVNIGTQQGLTITGIGTDNVTISPGLTETADPGDTVTFTRRASILTDGTEERIDYRENDRARSLRDNAQAEIVDEDGNILKVLTLGNTSDWYSAQKISLSTGDLFWSSIAPKPVATDFASQRGSRGDAMHIAVFDDLGTVSGIKANLIEKHLFVSKGTDTESTQNSPLKLWWKNYLARYSQYIYGGADISLQEDSDRGIIPVAIDLADNSFASKSSTWNQDVQDKSFKCIGAAVFDLEKGNNYSANNGYQADVSKVVSGYSLFSNKDEVAVDFLLMGPSERTELDTRVKANYLIGLAEARKDCIACISPDTTDVVNQTNTETQTENVIEFFSSLASSTYAVFDSGYKYAYDRFSSNFYYLPCNADIAGLMVRTAVNAYPWFSPAGTQRGSINNAIKLAYNPSKAQRDRLFANRINPVITQSGSGTILFGDKTASAYATAFDRINVRRLFLTIEQAIEKAAKDQLFELNDELTRANFVNIVDPYLRDIQAKRGVYDYLVVCDSSNNTPDVIDNNEFRADIFVKPTKSINYITLTFVATRTGISFSEVAGRV